MPIANTQELFGHELCEIYDAEHSAEELLQQAMNGGGREVEGPIEEAKDKLTGSRRATSE